MIWVKCPKCSKKATVIRSGTGYRSSVVSCTNCGYSHSTIHDGDQIAGPVQVIVEGVCPDCFNRGKYSRVLDRTPSNQAFPVRCDECNSAHHADVKQSVPCIAIHGDPYEETTGLILYLRTPCCGKILYASNPDMVESIHELVSRTHDRAHCQWLPKWVLKAKNRQEVLRALERLSELARMSTE